MSIEPTPPVVPPNAAAWAGETTKRAPFILAPDVAIDVRTVTPEQLDAIAAESAKALAPEKPLPDYKPFRVVGQPQAFTRAAPQPKDGE